MTVREGGRTEVGVLVEEVGDNKGGGGVTSEHADGSSEEDVLVLMVIAHPRQEVVEHSTVHAQSINQLITSEEV